MSPACRLRVETIFDYIKFWANMKLWSKCVSYYTRFHNDLVMREGGIRPQDPLVKTCQVDVA